MPPGDFIYKSDFVVLHHCLDINIAGYFILSPIRHIESFGELNYEELQDLAAILKLVTNVLTKEEDIDRVYALSIGEETKHLHMHLFPRYNWMLKISHQYIYTNGKVDGGKLFSYVREKYQVDKQDLFDSRLSLIVNAMRRALS